MGGWDHLAYVAQHYYPRGDGDKITDPAEERRLLLSPDLYQAYQKLYDAFVPAAKAKGTGYRLEETNSYGRGGAVGVSDTLRRHCGAWITCIGGHRTMRWGSIFIAPKKKSREACPARTNQMSTPL
jgi:hypothetical protein